MNFEPLVLGDSLELLIDNRGKNPPYAASGVPVVSGMSVRPDGLDLRDSKFASATTWRQWMPNPTRRDDVVMTSEAPLGRVALVRTDEPMLIAQRVFGLRGRAGVLDSRFLYYALQSAPVQADLASRATGSTVLGIRQPELKKVRIPAPGFGQQQGIADVLGALDDKMAANERVIKSAQALMLSLVPLVDDTCSLSELAQQSTASVQPDGFDEVVAHFSLPAFDAGAVAEIVVRDDIKSNKFILSEPCVLFSKLNPRIPRIWDVGVIPDEMSVASTEFVVLLPKDSDSAVLWAALAQQEVSDEIRQMVAGTSGSHQRVRPADLLGVRVRDVRMLDATSATAIATLGLICHERRRESSALARTRDELLPLLMSGKLRVKDAEAASEVL